MEGDGGITTLTKSEAKNAAIFNPGNLSKEEMDSSRVLEIGGRYNDAVMIKHLEMSFADFNRYNPNFNSRSATDGKYSLRLPSQKMEIFLTKKYIILEESMQYLLSR